MCSTVYIYIPVHLMSDIQALSARESSAKQKETARSTHTCTARKRCGPSADSD